MDKVISLAKKAGLPTLAWEEETKAFYLLARADLEADLAATRELAEGYAQERNELKAEMQEQCRIIGMGGQREVKLLADNERLRTTLRNLLAYANSLEMHDANADGEHRVMQAARAALEER